MRCNTGTFAQEDSNIDKSYLIPPIAPACLRAIVATQVAGVAAVAWRQQGCESGLSQFEREFPVPPALGRILMNRTPPRNILPRHVLLRPC